MHAAQHSILAQTTPVELVTNQLILLATIVGAIAALPALIEFIINWRKRRERVQLSMDDAPASATPVKLAGLDDLLSDIADLIDRAKHPTAYPGLTLGNELLIIGPALSGKKHLARRIAQLASLDRIITIYNPRNADALAHAKGLLRRSSTQRIMLLLPSLDLVFNTAANQIPHPQSERDEEVEAELDALIETVANRPNVLVIGTATRITEGDDLDNLFGMKIMLPGALPITKRQSRPGPSELAVLREVAALYLQDAAAAGCALQDISQDEAITRILARIGNAAEVQDVIEAARTNAIYVARTNNNSKAAITPASLEKGLRLVMGS